jgi:hypothetical protein
MLRIVGIRLDIAQAIAESTPLLLVEFAVGEIGTQCRFHLVEIAVAAEFTASHRDDAAVCDDLPVAVAMIEGRQELAHRQVAGSAENDEVEDLHGEELGHRGSWSEFRVTLLHSLQLMPR